MAAAVDKGDRTFTGTVDMSDATVTFPTAITAADNMTWTGTHEFDSTADFDGAVTFDSTADFNGAVTFDSTVDCDDVLDLSGASIVATGRVLAADAALTIAATDKWIELNITTGTTAATMTATSAGHSFTVYAGVRSGGAYTFACTRGATSGTVTIDAVGEGAIFLRDASVWRLVSLLGGATFA